ncbi:MAG TPA: SLATT domain-containing protein [Candidatus Nitrosopolaris sp.]|nr:SLATT domain-containing protein [Candidatus Nitrosopolaris sp.]
MSASPEAVELRQLLRDTLWTEKGHFMLASAWRAAHLVIGLTATAASGVAGATIIAQSSRIVSGTAALVGTVAGGLLTLLKPREISDNHLSSGRRLGALRVEMRQVLNLDAPNQAGTSQLRSVIKDLAAKKAQIDGASPHVADMAMAVVGWRMKRGEYGDTM